MKKTIIIILEYIGLVLSFLLHQKVLSILSTFRNRIYTGYLKKDFKHFGNSLFHYKAYHIKGAAFIEIGDNNIFEKDLQLTAWSVTPSTPTLKIGNNCLIRRGHVTASNAIIIGNGLLTGTNVLITDNSHGNTNHSSLQVPPVKRPIVSNGKVVIGNNVWLGNNVCILPNVHIGDGVVIGANSIVTHDIPSYAVAAGIPAKVIKTYNT